MLEVEVKVRLDSFDVLIEKLEEMGFAEGTTVYEYDVYFNGKNVDLKAEDKALRIRTHRNVKTDVTKYVLNFKGPRVDESTMTREETQFEVPSLEAGLTVINGLGYFEAGNVEKIRIHYETLGITCCLDEVTDLGKYLEIEIMAEDENSYEDAMEQIRELLDLLGMTLDDTVRKSYLSMIQEIKGE